MDSLESMCNLKINISWIHYSRTFGIHYAVTINVCKIYELLTVSLGTTLFTICQIVLFPNLWNINNSQIIDLLYVKQIIETFKLLYVTCLYWLLIKSKIDFKMLLLTYKVFRETDSVTFSQWTDERELDYLCFSEAFTWDKVANPLAT